MYTPQNKVKQAIKFGKWDVSLNGDLDYDNGSYFIDANRLTEKDWVAHLFEKGWIDWNDFIPAYFQALKNIGQEFVTLRVFY